MKRHLVEYDFTYYYIIEYLSKIIEKYTTNGKIDLMDYFTNIFIKNIDIWGFTMIYIDFYENINSPKICRKIKDIIIRFLYENPLVTIDTKLLVQELSSLNPMINTMKNTMKKRNKTRRYTRKQI